jgi:hypothetical protein
MAVDGTCRIDEKVCSGDEKICVKSWLEQTGDGQPVQDKQ